jgi:hypothetical protein
MRLGSSTTVGPSFFEVEEPHGVHGRGVAGQEQRLRVHQGVEDETLLLASTPAARCPSRIDVHRHRRDAVEERFHGPRAVEVVVDRSTVASSGTPSKYSRVPIDVSTRPAW